MSSYDTLVGQSFSRNGELCTIVACHGASVLATVIGDEQEEPIKVPLAEALEALAVAEVTVTELPRSRLDRMH